MNEDKVVRVYRRICVDEENEEWNTVAVPSRCSVEDIFTELRKQNVQVHEKALADFTNINHKVC